MSTIIDDRYHEEAHEAALKRQGAKEALENLCEAIREQIADLEVPVEAGGEFPPGYFDEIEFDGVKLSELTVKGGAA